MPQWQARLLLEKGDERAAEFLDDVADALVLAVAVAHGFVGNGHGQEECVVDGYDAEEGCSRECFRRGSVLLCNHRFLLGNARHPP